MAKCIYSWLDLNEDNPPNDATRSKEHIIPWAIGGSDGLVTDDVSKKWNNDFGSQIDKPFSDVLPIAISRHELRIEGQSGSIPPIEWKLRSVQTNDQATMTITANGDVSFMFEPVVVTEQHARYTRRLVAGSEDKVKRIFDGMLKSVKEKNQAIYDPNGDVLESWESALARAEIEQTTEFSGEIVGMNFIDWNRGMFKIALGLGHLVLGSDWTFSSSGDRLRAILVNDRKDWPAFSGINPPLPPEIARCLGIDRNVRDRRQHTLIVLPGPQPMAVISLFGDSVPKFAISLGDIQGNFGKRERMPVDQLVGFRVDPVSRTTTNISIADLCRYCGNV
jgi:hypothetical protein